ncbi:MAG: SRPBCC domain-containing protein [Saprospiraceae bacterium]
MKYLPFLFLLINVQILTGQAVKNTSYVTQTGEKVLRLETILPVDKKEAWQLFTTDESLKKWVAPVAHIELKTGGYLVTNYDKTKSLSDSSSIKLTIINYLEQELLTFKVELNDNFSKSAQNEDGNLQEIIQFITEGPKKTKIISSMIGWGQGDDWTKTYNFFVRGNIYTYEELIKIVK